MLYDSNSTSKTRIKTVSWKSHPMICNEVFRIFTISRGDTKQKSYIKVHFILLGKILISYSKIQPVRPRFEIIL